MLDQAFEALKTYDWGTDPKVLQPIDDAIVATHTDAAARKALEDRLIAALGTAPSRAAKDAICRALRTVGTAAAVPALAALLPNAELSHMARYALERIPDPAAGAALRVALPGVSGQLKIGIIGSLGVRGADGEAVPAGGWFSFLRRPDRSGTVPVLGALLTDTDAAVARAAACALGDIGTPAAGQALMAAPAAAGIQAAVADALLACAEQLRAAGHTGAARTAYASLLKGSPSKLVRAAAEQGLKLCGY